MQVNLNDPNIRMLLPRLIPMMLEQQMEEQQRQQQENLISTLISRMQSSQQQGPPIEPPSLPGEFFGGGPAAPITYGRDASGVAAFNNMGRMLPETELDYFGNLPPGQSELPPGRVGEVARKYNLRAFGPGGAIEGGTPNLEALAGRAAPYAKSKGLSPEQLSDLSQLSAVLSARKVPPAMAEQILHHASGGRFGSSGDKALQEFIAKERAKSALSQELKTVSDEKGYVWLDPKTGQPAQADLTLGDAKAQGFKRVPEARFQQAQSALNGLELINQYESLAKELGLPKEPGIAGVALSGLDIKRRRLGGDPVVAQLDSLAAGISQFALAFGADRRITDTERKLLFQAVTGDWDSLPSALSRLNTARGQIAKIARRLDIPLPEGILSGSVVGAEATGDVSGLATPGQSTGLPTRIRNKKTGKTLKLLPGMPMPQGWEAVK